MTDSLTVELDDDARLALAVLTRDGSSVSVAICRALVRAAAAAVQEQLRDEAAGLAADEDDRTEALQVLRDMATLRGCEVSSAEAQDLVVAIQRSP